MVQSTTDRVDLAVAGAGIVGLSTALAVRRAAGSARVLVCDPELDGRSTGGNLRALAITASSRGFLARLGVWDAVAARAQPMTGMVLADGRPGAQPPQTYLRFLGEVAPGEHFAHMLFQNDLRAALHDACRHAGIVLKRTRIMAFAARPAGLDLDLDPHDLVSARLLVAADGGRSRLREQAGIRTLGWDYGQAAIVATLAHDRDHEGRATQQFLPGGPLAMLPMRADDGSGRRSSLVWTERQAAAERLLALSPSGFLEALRERIGNGYGTLNLEDRPSGHPLRLSLARDLAGPRLALVGDAARTIHPLAGQGLNLGLADAEALADAAAQALHLGLDPGAPDVLARYQRSRRADATLMAVTTDGLNRLFSTDRGPLRLLRDLGLGLIDRTPGLKRRLMHEAAGIASSQGRRPTRRRPGA